MGRQKFIPGNTGDIRVLYSNDIRLSAFSVKLFRVKKKEEEKKRYINQIVRISYSRVRGMSVPWSFTPCA